MNPRLASPYQSPGTRWL